MSKYQILKKFIEGNDTYLLIFLKNIEGKILNIWI